MFSQRNQSNINRMTSISEIDYNELINPDIDTHPSTRTNSLFNLAIDPLVKVKPPKEITAGVKTSPIIIEPFNDRIGIPINLWFRDYERMAAANYWSENDKRVQLYFNVAPNVQKFMDSVCGDEDTYEILKKHLIKRYSSNLTKMLDLTQVLNRKYDRKCETLDSYYYDKLNLLECYSTELSNTQLIDFILEGIDKNLLGVYKSLTVNAKPENLQKFKNLLDWSVDINKDKNTKSESGLAMLGDPSKKFQRNDGPLFNANRRNNSINYFEIYPDFADEDDNSSQNSDFDGNNESGENYSSSLNEKSGGTRFGEWEQRQKDNRSQIPENDGISEEGVSDYTPIGQENEYEPYWMDSNESDEQTDDNKNLWIEESESAEEKLDYTEHDLVEEDKSVGQPDMNEIIWAEESENSDEQPNYTEYDWVDSNYNSNGQSNGSDDEWIEENDDSHEQPNYDWVDDSDEIYNFENIFDQEEHEKESNSTEEEDVIKLFFNQIQL